MIRALSKFAQNLYGGIEIDTTSNSGEYRDLSPFVLNATEYGSKNFENLWQYSKVYNHQVDTNGNPTNEWFWWRREGFSDSKAHRYPMGKGAIPLYSIFPQSYDNRMTEHLGYIKARKQIYVSLYAKLVRQTESYKLLEFFFNSGKDIILRDYDAYDHIKLNMTLTDVLNNPNKKMGHSFVLIMMLLDMISLKEE